jgi:hypothetical protein
MRWQRAAALTGGVAYGDPARTGARGTRSTRSTILAALVVALIGVLVYQALAPPSSSKSPAPSAAPPIVPHGDHQGTRGEADGGVPGGVTVFDDDLPAVANLDPDLLGALRRAATDAAGDGVELFVTSGWRSPEYQERLLREAVREYGSAEEAARWVASADTSAHVSGDAVDIGPSDAAAWLSEHGAGHGLCQVYRNESWHYELRPEAIYDSCPPMYADPTHDPRMQQ